MLPLPTTALRAASILLFGGVPMLHGFLVQSDVICVKKASRKYEPLECYNSRKERARALPFLGLNCSISENANQPVPKNVNHNTASNVVKQSPSETRRRSVLSSVCFVTGSMLLFDAASAPVHAASVSGGDLEPITAGAMTNSNDQSSNAQLQRPFQSGGFGKEEYTNAFVASRDTNISPKEAYDTIMTAGSSNLSPSSRDGSTLSMSTKPSSAFFGRESLDAAIRDGRTPRALDMGCGAGVSTQFLWQQGFHDIDAVDWSSDAWDRFVIEDPSGYCPPSVTFYEMDDERYRRQWRRSRAATSNSGQSTNQLFDVIVYNFAVNESKAKSMAQELLVPSSGRLLAPVNIQTDYWLKQEYRLYDQTGNMLWKAFEIGAWSVQFQPDVTQDSCQGIWCAPFNGFQKAKD